MKPHGTPIVKTVLRRKKVGRFTLPDFRIYCKATVIKTVWHCHKDRHIDQRNKIVSLEINPHIFGQMIFDKGAKST